MNNIKSIEETLKELINNDLSETINEIKRLPASGSSRSYYRVFTKEKSYIATYSTNVEENTAFLIFSKHFKSKGLPVPEIFAINDDKTCYIQSDFGDVSLFDYVNKSLQNKSYDVTTIELYKKAISCLIDFQIRGNDGLDYSVAYPTSTFNKESIINDLNYFKYYFLKLNEEIVFNETRLDHDFQRLADFAMEAPSDYFMYRDFQSRNIMIKDNTPLFIDYQGGRKGPLQYDIISLLYQVKAQIPDDLRKELLSYYKEKLNSYLNIEEIGFDKYYKTFVLIRLLQVLGAYGFRGLIQKKSHFMESIPYALNELVVLKDNLNFSIELRELSSVLNQMELLLKKYKVTENEKLTVTINSFSFKNGGVPQDLSGNGGGFVFDCRSLPNPGRYEEYMKLNGEDIEVQEFLNKKQEVHSFFELTNNIIYQSVDNYLQRDFKNLSVSFGCTGGQHRSVFFAEKMACALRDKYPQTRVVLNHIAQNKHYVYESE